MRSPTDGRRSGLLLLTVVTGRVLLPPAGVPTAAAATFIVTNGNDSGPGSFRAAIVAANANPGADTIVFNIPGLSPQAITPQSPLPCVTDTVDIDGGQVGHIELRGDLLVDRLAAGLALCGEGAAGSTVSNLVINSFSEAGILIFKSSLNSITGNFIGTNFQGTGSYGNRFGVLVIDGGDNMIGGGAPGQGNLISGNHLGGVVLAGAIANGNSVLGNWIGTDFAGHYTLGNGPLGGVAICCGSSGNQIGASDFRRPVGFRGRLVLPHVVPLVRPHNGNVIAGNKGYGINMDGLMLDVSTLPVGALRDSQYFDNFVQNNIIQFNGDSGVRITGRFYPQRNLVGGLSQNEGNIISGNGGDGVTIQGLALGNPILSNSIHRNTYLGIDLGADGVTLNDSNGHVGGNDFQNFPVLTSATTYNDQTTIITGSLGANPDSAYLIQFFSNSFCDISGFGQGEALIASKQVVTNNNGDGTGSAFFSVLVRPEVYAGRSVTATATNVSGGEIGDTSEFSQCRKVIAAVPCPLCER